MSRLERRVPVIRSEHHADARPAGDRDCSMQRRYQKLLEIAPAPLLCDDLRAEIHKAALRFGRAVDGLCGLATVEFLVDVHRGIYYFMECNPRLQVEATITEEVCSVDLVTTQLRLAHGASLPDLFETEASEMATTSRPLRAVLGSAVQARVSATALAPIAIYCEPAGDVRVDSAAYASLPALPRTAPPLRLPATCSVGLRDRKPDRNANKRYM